MHLDWKSTLVKDRGAIKWKRTNDNVASGIDWVWSAIPYLIAMLIPSVDIHTDPTLVYTSMNAMKVLKLTNQVIINDIHVTSISVSVLLAGDNRSLNDVALACAHHSAFLAGTDTLIVSTECRQWRNSSGAHQA